MVDISVVLPAYNEGKNVIPMYKNLKFVLDRLEKSYEIIFVDDGSRDRTFENLAMINKEDKKLRVIQFQRRFEKAAALSAGFIEAKGDIIITMDADLQDDPREIPRFLEKLNSGYDIVVGWKYKRKDPLARIMASRLFNFLVRRLTGIKLHDSDCNFRAMRKEVIKNINVYSGLYRFIPSLANAKGYRVGEIKIVHHKRRFGRSRYGLSRLIKGFFDLLTIKFLMSYTKRPMHLFGLIGIFSTLIGFVIAAYLAVIRLLFGQLIGNRPLLLLAILLIILGLQFISIGLIGEMITSTTHKKEEQFVVKRKL